MSFLNFSFKVTETKEVAPNILIVKTEPDVNVDFLGGQYFSFKIADRINRSYSTLSAPGEGSIDFLVDISPQGPGSVFVQNLKVGDVFKAMGPFGFFTLEKTGVLNEDSPIAFVATGTGIVPMRSMLLDLLRNKKSSRNITLYFGLRNDKQAYLFEEFVELEKEFANFTFVPVISRPSTNWYGRVGYCQDIIKAQLPETSTKFFVCGRNETVKSICDALVEFGYPKENIFYEKFG